MEPRPAATVVLARPSRGGVEVLALMRSMGTRFLPGFVVFPGGVIDEEDEVLAARLFGDAAEAARACALRELYEEAGVLITSGGLERRAPAGELESLRFDPPPAGALVEIARWIAPEALAMRFDARFFAIEAPPRLEAVPDGAEIERAWWARPADLLEAAARGDGPLMWPTRVTVQALARCRSVDDVLSLRVEQVPPP